MEKRVGVVVVDDSPICRQLICDALEKDPEIRVIGTCADGQQAVHMVRELKPQVVTMDVDMPVMDGLTAVEQIMAETPVPILVLTADPRSQKPELTCQALELGALALQVKPSMDAGPQAWNLTREVKLISSVKVIRHLRNRRIGGDSKTPVPMSLPSDPALFTNSPVGLVAIGSSTGGPQVIHKMFSELPADFPAPIVLVQHINAAFAESLAGWLAAASKIKVRLARDGDALVPGEALVAPSSHHMVIPSRGRVLLRGGEPKDGHLPSATLLLESAAKAYGRRAVGVILSGMGTDGSDGMLAIKKAGGITLAQSQESCVVYGMPGSAISKNAVTNIVHGDELAQSLVHLARGGVLVQPTR